MSGPRRYYNRYDSCYDYDYDPFGDEDQFTRAVWRGYKEVCNTSANDKKIRENLKEALNNLQMCTGEDEGSSASSDKPYFCVESSFSSENIHVSVESVGDLKFPLESDIIEKMSLTSSKAKFGKGSETLLDLNVRDTWMIPASNLKVDIEDDAYASLLQEIKAGLNIDSSFTIVPHPYNMLIYGKNQFFKSHTDAEKVENMIATLVLILPSLYKGGNLNVRREGQKYSFNRSEDMSEIKWIAFYPDCSHQIHPVEEGFRVVLTFNVEMKPPPQVTITALSTNEIDTELNKCVGEFFNGSNRPKKLIYLLNHCYSENSLKWHLLKGDDKMKGHALYVVAERQNLVPCLALAEDEEFEVDHPAGRAQKMMSTTKIKFLVGKDSEKLLGSPAYPLEYGYDREICYSKRSMKIIDYFQYYGEGTSGNEKSKREYRYHRACVILCDASLIPTATANEKMKSLTTKVVEVVKELSNGAESKEEAGSQQSKPLKVIEGTVPSSEVLVSLHKEGSLPYPPPKTLVKKLIYMSEGLERLEPHVIKPNRIDVDIKTPVWNNIISNISSGLDVNSKCKLVPQLRGLRMYDDFHKDIGIQIAPWGCAAIWETYPYHCIGCYNLCHNEFCRGELKVERGDITLVLILPGLTQGNFSVKYVGESNCISDWDKLESVKYIACYSESNINVFDRKGTCLYLLYNIELQSDPNMNPEIDTSIVNEPLSNAIKEYFSDDIQPQKLIYLLNHDYSKKKLRWHMLKGSDETVANSFYAVAKQQNLEPYLAYTEITDHRSEAFKSEEDFQTVIETHVKLVILVDGNNLEVKPSSDKFYLVNKGEVCFTLSNQVHSKPFKIEEPTLTESIHHYYRACVLLCKK